MRTPRTKAYFEQNPDEPCKDQSLLSRPMQACLAKLGSMFAFVVVETWRAGSRQELMVKTGKSWTHNSTHETGDAADTMPVGGYDKPMNWSKMHDAWDKIVMEHKDPEWIVVPEKRIGKDMGHFGLIRKPRKKPSV